MKPYILSIFTIFFFSGTIFSQNPLLQVTKGKVERIENFESRYVSARNIDIWLPEDYSDSSKYAVLYMHDGQMLYDASQSWNHQAWEVDEVASELNLKPKIKNFIVVGIWNSGASRHSDYFPQKPYEQLSKPEKDTVIAQLIKIGKTNENFEPRSDLYLKFIVEELKPYIEKSYSVKNDKENTFITGSSMGGLISLYAICEYPEVFGGAACLSTHWTGTFTLENNPFPDSLLQYLKHNLPRPETHKIYFDTGDQTLDALYPKIQMKVDQLMIQKRYSNSNWITEYFPGEDHSEKAWSKRLHIPLEFLLTK